MLTFQVIGEVVGVVSLAAWIYLVFGRGGFWRMRESPAPKLTGGAKSIAVVIPARNEEAVVGQAIGSLLQQDYPGPLRVFLVDDHSTDRTIASAGSHQRLTIVKARPLPDGWTGKLWAISEGLEQAAVEPDYILLTDADIVHAPDNIAGLVARAEAGNLDLVSYMVKLQCRTLAERALIPAFVFFFFKLYPPAWIARRDRKTAGAAGGCMLIRRSALERMGGIATIRGDLIDDCALARAVKRSGGAIWLGLTRETRSIRDYTNFGEIRNMIARTAFTQLRYSTGLLIGTILAMAIIYLAPPLLLLTGDPITAGCGAAAWSLMSISYLPTLRLYGLSIAWAPLLPRVALFYMVATVDSALRYWTGRGGEWKGRVQVGRTPRPRRSPWSGSAN
ncbi:MAG TPA: glycosyltransferase [Bryobacteraceae bacterium]|jgi:hopene-associated glycosyltransferase HpnB|nr:glycosyltransferase [Bryobacteraceae bacterium]